MCSVGNQNSDNLVKFVIVPLFFYLVLSTASIWIEWLILMWKAKSSPLPPPPPLLQDHASDQVRHDRLARAVKRFDFCLIAAVFCRARVHVSGDKVGGVVHVN